MLRIRTKEFEYEIPYNGISLISSNNTLLAYKNLFVNSDIYIDDNKIKKDDLIYIDELSKISDFIDMSKKSFIVEMINNHLFDNQLINQESINNITKTINETLGFELLESCIGDNNKMIQLLFELCEDNYLNSNILEIIIQHCFSNKKLIIFNNLSWLKIEWLYKFINEYNFIIITNEIRDYLANMKMLEIVSNYNISRKEINPIYDLDKFISYIEKNISEPFDNKLFKEFIDDKSSFKSLKILNLILNL